METDALRTAERRARIVITRRDMKAIRETSPLPPGAPLISPNSVTTLDARIRSRAYELYEHRGAQDGQALDDWLQAERELLTIQSAVAG